jgi:hypothetical protein
MAGPIGFTIAWLIGGLVHTDTKIRSASPFHGPADAIT